MKKRSSLSNTIKDTSTIMRNPLPEYKYTCIYSISYVVGTRNGFMTSAVCKTSNYGIVCTAHNLYPAHGKGGCSPWLNIHVHVAIIFRAADGSLGLIAIQANFLYIQAAAYSCKLF